MQQRSAIDPMPDGTVKLSDFLESPLIEMRGKSLIVRAG